METPLITYSLANRDRVHRGKPRNYQRPAAMRRIVSAINSPEAQERVKHGDMVGYYGHTFRAQFGMTPPESILVNGQVVMLEPAFQTTHLVAHPDGTVEHRARFLENGPGKIAAGLFENRVGGWSSAIDDIKPEFCGFDYVQEPNFSSNRGYKRANLDSVDGGAIFDAVVVQSYNEQIRGMAALLDSVTTAHRQTLESLLRLQAENEELIAILAGGQSGEPTSIMDSIGEAPLIVMADRGELMARATAAFMSIGDLPGFVRPEVVRETPSERRAMNQWFRNRLGRR